jgi:hypothetical protein
VGADDGVKPLRRSSVADSEGNDVLTCKTVATALGKRDLDVHSPRMRVRILRHLAGCEHCVTFAGQLDALRKAAAAMSEAFDAEAPDLEMKIVRRIGKVS